MSKAVIFLVSDDLHFEINNMGRKVVTAMGDSKMLNFGFVSDELSDKLLCTLESLGELVSSTTVTTIVELDQDGNIISRDVVEGNDVD